MSSRMKLISDKLAKCRELLKVCYFTDKPKIDEINISFQSFLAANFNKEMLKSEFPYLYKTYFKWENDVVKTDKD